MRATTFVNAIVFAAGLTLGANSLAAAPSANDWIHQQLKGKQGQTPSEHRADAQVNVAAPNWIEEHLKGKLGHYSPMEEARIREVQNSSAYRAEAPATGPVLSWIEQHNKVKQGR